MPDILGLVIGFAVIVLIALLFIGLMAAAMLAWGFARAAAARDEKPEIVELKRQLDGGLISVKEYEARMRELRARR